MKNRTRFVTAVLAVLAAIALLFIPLPQRIDLDTRIVTVASIHRPPAVVFDYVTTPAHWPVWHPSSLAVSGSVDHPLDLGEQVTEEFSVAGRRGRVVWTVAARELPSKWTIEGKIDGRPAGTLTYSLTSTASGTRFEREFTYRAPSLWFAIFNWFMLRARIQLESDTAVLRLKSLLEAAPLHEQSRSAGLAICRFTTRLDPPAFVAIRRLTNFSGAMTAFGKIERSRSIVVFSFI